MKKLIALLGFFFLSGTYAWSQAPNYDDLIILFADANYKKLISEATKYTLKDDTKNDPLPYLYLSKGLYAISQQGDKDPVYKNAYRESIGALGKFIKKDKKNEVQGEHSEYIEQIKATIVESIHNELELKTYKKVSSLVNNYFKIKAGDTGGKLLEAASKYRDNDKSTANLLWKEFEKKLLEMTDVSGLSESDLDMLRMGICESAECFVHSKQIPRAQALLNKGKELIGDDEEFMERYNQLMN